MEKRNVRASTSARRLPRGVRWLLIVAGVVVLVAVVGRLVLDPIAAHYTAKTLAKSDQFKATFSGVHVSLFPPAYEIRKFKLMELPGGRWDEPLFYVEKASTSILWRELLRGHLVGKVWLDKPKAVAVRQHEKKAKKGAEAGNDLEDMVPLKVDRLEIVDGEVLLAVGAGKKAPQLWIHDLNLVAENLATRKALMEGEPSRLRLRGRVQRSGVLSVDGAMDPWAKSLTFNAKGSLLKLQARELYAFMAKETNLQAEQGTIDVFVEAKARNGVLSGGVKPVLKNLEIASVGDNFGTRLKAALADAAVNVLSDDDPNRNAVATTIPIKGRIDDPEVQLLPTVLGVIRNAFVIGLREGFTNLPPKTAEKKEGVIKQALHALKPGAGPPKAQPENAAKSQPAPPASHHGRTKPNSR